jgi:hypothetical protein
MPQTPRSLPEQAYFDRCVRTMPSIIRNCDFAYFYPRSKPRLWILYEMTQFLFTCTQDLGRTSDIAPFLQHIEEMVDTGVRVTLTKYDYGCSYDQDRQYLISWLELLVLLRRLDFSNSSIRGMIDSLTWFKDFESHDLETEGAVLEKFQGTLDLKGITDKFTPISALGQCQKTHLWCLLMDNTRMMECIRRKTYATMLYTTGIGRQRQRKWKGRLMSISLS